MRRMTKLSKSNLLVCSACGLSAVEGGFVVWVELNGNRAIVHDSLSPLVYPSASHALRAVRRLRPDLMVSSI